MVFDSPPRESFRKWVSLESRYGTYVAVVVVAVAPTPPAEGARARKTLPRVVSDWLIKRVSRPRRRSYRAKVCGLEVDMLDVSGCCIIDVDVWYFDKRSEPARSTRLSLPQYLALLSACFHVT